jgi:hypothetical protein
MTTLQAVADTATARRFRLGVAAYLVPTFPIAYVWHLVVFAPAYEALGIYRPDPIISFGFASMLIQAIAFSWAYPQLLPGRGSAVLKPGAQLRARARCSVVVVHDARGRRQESHDFRTRVHPAGERLHAAAVSIRRTADCARLSQLIARAALDCRS